MTITRDIVTSGFSHATQQRRSLRDLQSTSPVADDTILALAKEALRVTPSAFNSQTTRLTILLGTEHQKLWSITGNALVAEIGEDRWNAGTKERIAKYANPYGKILFWDDMEAAEAMRNNHSPDLYSFSPRCRGNGAQNRAFLTPFSAAFSPHCEDAPLPPCLARPLPQCTQTCGAPIFLIHKKLLGDAAKNQRPNHNFSRPYTLFLQPPRRIVHDAENRAEKRSKMRRSLGSTYANDHLQSFSTPVAIRKISTEIDNEAVELQSRIRQFSSSSDEPVGDEPNKPTLYVDSRGDLVKDLEEHIRKARKFIRETRTGLPSGSEKNELKRAYKELDKAERVLMRERAALATRRARVKLDVRSQPSFVKLGEAYMMAITENLPEPAASSYQKKHGRSATDQTSFRNRLIKSYNIEGSNKVTEEAIEETKYFPVVSLWCPVYGMEFTANQVRAAHLVPQSIGEINAAYLFGSKPSDGYDVLWSVQNGLLLHESVEHMLDNGEMVILPDPADDNEFISFILSEDLLKDKRPLYNNQPFKSIHKKRLQFQTDARPGKRYLYVHAMLTLFRRRRYDVPGWENDRERVFKGQIWASPGKWARKSIIEALAVEVGDCWEGIEEVGGLGEFPDTKSPEEEKQIATAIRYSTETKAEDLAEDSE